ncbi:MAG: hydantoinase/oxoprolinase family protein, partial [Actinomycetota bacterium]|nr:hydantoinase/oxoprolinase family protein [Actinomycetota bacterium]
QVSASSDVLPEFREYERFATTVADAYLSPKLAGYLQSLRARAKDAGLANVTVMQSSGGVVDLDTAAAGAAACVLSGPAAGVVGAAYVASESGFENVLTLDMGGTSTDVAAVVDGDVQTTTETTIGGIPIRFPAVDVHTVGAGGGSIAWIDSGGALRVGPRSAGAEPGPAAYGRGGDEPTVTDANLALGNLEDGMVLGGEVTLKRERAEVALKSVADHLEGGVEEAAAGVIRVANAEMARALRVVSIERGLDPRHFALVAFGGAGPMHACALAEELEIQTVLVPGSGGVLSALGLAISDMRRDYVSSVIPTRDEPDLDPTFRELETTAAKDLPGAELIRSADLRYRGQSFELTVEGDDLDKLRDAFHRAHARRYGFELSFEPVEVVNCRLTATIAAPKPKLAAPDGNGQRVDPGTIVKLAETTCVVGPDWEGRVDERGTLILKRT